jgi:hypothetical protein
MADSVYRRATGWTAGVRFQRGARDFSLLIIVQPGSGACPASCPMRKSGSFPGVKRPEQQADHSPPTSAEVENACSYTSNPSIRLHGVVLN